MLQGQRHIRYGINVNSFEQFAQSHPQFERPIMFTPFFASFVLALAPFELETVLYTSDYFRLVLKEYYIRHIDRFPVNSEAERQRVIQCLEPDIEIRVSEVCTVFWFKISFFLVSNYRNRKFAVKTNIGFLGILATYFCLCSIFPMLWDIFCVR